MLGHHWGVFQTPYKNACPYAPGLTLISHRLIIARINKSIWCILLIRVLRNITASIQNPATKINPVPTITNTKILKALTFLILDQVSSSLADSHSGPKIIGRRRNQWTWKGTWISTVNKTLNTMLIHTWKWLCSIILDQTKTYPTLKTTHKMISNSRCIQWLLIRVRWIVQKKKDLINTTKCWSWLIKTFKMIKARLKAACCSHPRTLRITSIIMILNRHLRKLHASLKRRLWVKCLNRIILNTVNLNQVKIKYSIKLFKIHPR